MAVSTIKHNEDGRPKRAKYRIVVLGNQDPHDWTKSDTYTPAMPFIDLRMIIVLAVHHRRPLRQGDFKQAFVQATLSTEEQYVLKPPAGCPLSEPNMYWLLRRTLYDLKRSVHHWFDKAPQILEKLNLIPLMNASCIFKGQVIPGEPLL